MTEEYLSPAPESRDEQWLAGELSLLAQQIQPDPVFLDHLEARLNQERDRMRTQIKRLVQFAAILAMVLTAFALSPALRGLAQDAWHFFVPAESDTQTVISHAPPEMDSDVRLETGSSAPFAVRYPAFVPPGYTLSRDAYQTVGSISTLVYECSAGDWGFVITQRPLASIDSAAEPNLAQLLVGSSAAVEAVTIHNSTAEYVRGEWTPATDPDFSGGGDASLDLIWNPALDVHHLMWAEDGFLFEVFTSRWSRTEPNNGACAMPKEDYIAVAESLK